jgi:hypothetical protein
MAMRRLEAGHLTVRGRHEDLVFHMCMFLNQLTAGDTYRTVSFPEFWDEENMGVMGRYLSMNRRVAVRGVHVRRVLVCRAPKPAPRSRSLTGRVLEAHRTAGARLGRGQSLNTRVRWVPQEQYLRWRKSDHFALWARGTDTIAIFPKYSPTRRRGRYQLERIRFVRLRDPADLVGRFDEHWAQAKKL